MKRAPIPKIGNKGKRIQKELNASRLLLHARSKGVCEHCGKHPQWMFVPGRPNLEPHHKDHNRNNNTMENIIMLAPYCHDMYQHKPKDWEGWPND